MGIVLHSMTNGSRFVCGVRKRPRGRDTYGTWGILGSLGGTYPVRPSSHQNSNSMISAYRALMSALAVSAIFMRVCVQHFLCILRLMFNFQGTHNEVKEVGTPQMSGPSPRPTPSHATPRPPKLHEQRFPDASLAIIKSF